MADRSRAIRKAHADRLLSFTRKTCVILFSVLLGNPLGYRILGLLNRCAGRPIRTIFLYYPAHVRYTRAVTFDWYARRVRWRPAPGGFYAVSLRYMGLVVGISCPEPELVAPGNAERLERTIAAVHHIRQLVGAESVALAGILPSVLARRGSALAPPSDDGTADILLEAIRRVAARHGLGHEAAVIVIGASGRIGRRVVAALRAAGHQRLTQLDIRRTGSLADLLAKIEAVRGEPGLVINVARRNTLDLYADALWPGLVVLNEVFPEAPASLQRKLGAMGIPYYHLAGVIGFALPRFPGAYRDAIPCCAVPGSRPARGHRIRIHGEPF